MLLIPLPVHSTGAELAAEDRTFHRGQITLHGVVASQEEVLDRRHDVVLYAERVVVHVVGLN